VSTYRTRLFEKLGLKNNIDLLALAARNRLVQL
jgi:DNA-binding CsgD family transcriptional regulator